MQELLLTIAKGLVEYPEQVRVVADQPDAEGKVVYHLLVAESDMGRVIGKKGRIAKAIRTVARSASVQTGEKLAVEIG